MHWFMAFCVIIFIQQPPSKAWNLWKFPPVETIWKRKYSSSKDQFTAHWKDVPGRVFASLLGYPSNCHLHGTSHACTLALTCWWIGGSSRSGCGMSSWIVSCCVASNFQSIEEKEVDEEETSYQHIETRENIIPQSLQRRNDILDKLEGTCGLSNDRILQKRIVGGKQAGFGQFPWQAYIKISSYQCGGVLVSRKFVATAAHCILPVKVSELLVYLGELDNQDTGEVEEFAPAELHRVKKRLIHPDFHYKATQPDRYDLALLELVTEAGWNFHISPICLPDASINLTGRDAVVAGWGKVDPLSKEIGTNVLRSVSVPIVDIKECMSWHKIKQIFVELHSEMICAGYEVGKQDACVGDSGGPLIVLEKGRWTLVGITSAGFGCGEPHQPGIYHRVSTSVPWIRAIIKNN